MENNLRKQCLYLEYLSDIDDQTNNQNKKSLKERVQHLENSLNNPDLHWVDLFYKNEPVGFVIYGDGNMCHPDADIMIYDAFVKYEFRRRGVMTRAFDNLCKGKRVCMFINNANAFARKFWVGLMLRRLYGSVSLKRTKSEERMNKLGFSLYCFEYRPELYNNTAPSLEVSL